MGHTYPCIEGGCGVFSFPPDQCVGRCGIHAYLNKTLRFDWLILGKSGFFEPLILSKYHKYESGFFCFIFLFINQEKGCTQFLVQIGQDATDIYGFDFAVYPNFPAPDFLFAMKKNISLEVSIFNSFGAKCEIQRAGVENKYAKPALGRVCGKTCPLKQV